MRTRPALTRGVVTPCWWGVGEDVLAAFCSGAEGGSPGDPFRMICRMRTSWVAGSTSIGCVGEGAFRVCAAWTEGFTTDTAGVPDIPGTGRGTSRGLVTGGAACSFAEGTQRSVVRIRQVEVRWGSGMAFYMLPEFIIRGPMRKMGSMDPVKTRPIRNTAAASVRKLMTWVKSAM